MHPAHSRLAHTQEETLMRKQTVMRKLMASKGQARRSAQVSTLALAVAALATSAPNAVAATPVRRADLGRATADPNRARLFGQRRLGREDLCCGRVHSRRGERAQHS